MQLLRLAPILFCSLLAVSANGAAPSPKVPSPAVPKESPGLWITAGDYPAEALRNDYEGVVGFRILVGADGLPTGCELTRSSGYPSLDERTCERLMLRARFDPALDPSGKPTTGTYANSIRWVLPTNDQPTVIEPTTQVMTFVVDEKGNISDCRQTITTPAGTREAPGVGPCAGNAKMTPFLDQSGKPTSKRINFISKIEIEDINR